MATYEHDILMQYIDETGNMHINYPATKAKNVMIGDSDVQIKINALQKRPVNNNLLDNPFFTINQRGVTTFTGNYGVDRWIASNNTVCTVNEDGSISISANDSINTLYQRIEPDRILGKTVTLSAIIDDGQIISVSGSLPESLPSESAVLLQSKTVNELQVEVYYQQANGLFECQVLNTSTSNTHIVRAVKLEVGTESTLANDTSPNYQLELLKCQYYYRIISSYSLRYYSWNPDIIYFNCDLLMRTKPSVTINPNILMIVNGTATTGFSFSFHGYLSLQLGGILFLKAEKTNHGINSNSHIFLAYDDERAIVASADL